jgi:serine/threonine protein kinase
MFAATDMRDDRLVALKVSRRSGASAIRLLNREASYLSLISHPNVPQLYDVGTLPDGRGYLALEWIEGDTLEGIVKEAGLAVTDAIRIAAAVADVLIALHAAQVIHRDIKPLNTMVPLNPVTRFAAAKVVDFSSARTLSETMEGGEPCTEFGRVAGSAFYMAPEQIAGRRQTVATDIFGLGATLYFMLFGCPPMGVESVPFADFSAPDAPRALMGPYIVRRLTEEVNIPAGAIVSAELQALLSSMLRLDPRERPSSMSQVLAELNRIQLDTSPNRQR